MISDGKLIVLHDAPYETESVLQQALASFPEVLAGQATTAGQPGGLLLIRREKGIPTTDAGSATFSVDHLFVDASGVPVIVEVKRSTDTRIRREVVGQMLDYAANGVKYWPVAQLRHDFESSCQKDGVDPESVLGAIAAGVDVEDYWQQVEQNLRSGHVRMVFVADRLPDELVRVIEFLNEQMSPAEVLGVEVQQFTDGTTQVLVPRLVGATAAAKATKERGTGTPWTAQTFLATAAERGASEFELTSMQKLFDHEASKGSKLSWGKGITPGVSGWYLAGSVPRPVWTVTASDGSSSSKARIYFYFVELEAVLNELSFAAFVDALRAVSALNTEIAQGGHKYPVVRLVQLNEADVNQILVAAEGLAAQSDDEVVAFD